MCIFTIPSPEIHVYFVSFALSFSSTCFISCSFFFSLLVGRLFDFAKIDGSLWLLNDEKLILFVFIVFPWIYVIFFVVILCRFISNQIFIRIVDHKIHLFGELVNWFAIISLLIVLPLINIVSSKYLRFVAWISNYWHGKKNLWHFHLNSSHATHNQLFREQWEAKRKIPKNKINHTFALIF